MFLEKSGHSVSGGAWGPDSGSRGLGHKPPWQEGGMPEQSWGQRFQGGPGLSRSGQGERLVSPRKGSRARSVGSLLLRRGAQAAWCWPGCAGVPVSGGTQPDAAPLTSLLPDEDVEVAHSLRCLVPGPLVLGSAAQEEAPHQPPQHGEAVLLGVVMPHHCGSCKAGADLGREAARDRG